MPKIVNLVGETFGLLKVLEKSERKDTGGKTMYWVECQCPLKTRFEARGTNLNPKKGETVGRTNSCGCQKSIGENNIALLLTEAKRIFAREYTFTGLVSIKKLRFDVAVMTEENVLDYLIEFDGIQHTQATGNGWNTVDNLLSTQARDALKNEYCKAHNIPLIRIPHTERDTITLEMITPATSKYLIR